MKKIILSIVLSILLISCSSKENESNKEVDIQATVNAAVKLALEKESNKIPTPTSALIPTPTVQKIFTIEELENWIYQEEDKEDIYEKNIEISGKFMRMKRNLFNVTFFLGTHSGIDCKFNPFIYPNVPNIVDSILVGSDFNISGRLNLLYNFLFGPDLLNHTDEPTILLPLK